MNPIRQRRALTAAMLSMALLTGVLTSVPAGAQPPPAHEKPIRLTPGEPRFWQSPALQHSPRPFYSTVGWRFTDDSSLPEQLRWCESDPGDCFSYQLVVPDSDLANHRLRIGLDWGVAYFSGRPDIEAREGINAHVRVYAPSGAQVAYADWDDTADIRMPAATAGEWTVLVIPITDRPDLRFRMRALLEEEPSPRHGPLEPNLRAIPPFDFKFKPPARTLNLPDGDDYPVTCAADELAEELLAEREPVHCLRFAAGIENTGPGPLHLRFSPDRGEIDPDDPLHLLKAPTAQVIHREDCTDAAGQSRACAMDDYDVHEGIGTMEYHPTHQHYHFTGFAHFEWFHVVKKNNLADEPVVARKNGFCLLAQKIADWDQFYQAPRTDNASGGCGEASSLASANSDGHRMFLPSGWGDPYRGNRPGNYVPFSGEPGEYVLRVTTDPGNNIKETDEGDNVSYAHVRISAADNDIGFTVEMLERGYGGDPWDKNKTKIANGW